MKYLSRKIDSNIILEFWEWSKSSYGQDKANVDAQNTMVSFNSQHGYGEVGQWVKTQDGDVFIEEISDSRYRGFDRDGELKTGHINDIIRTLIKSEVIGEGMSYYNESLILENKQQALSILNKNEIEHDNPMFIELMDNVQKIFNNLNYLGLVTKFIFEQDAPFHEILDLLPWLKQSGDKLPKNPLSYKNFESLKDDIIICDNQQRVRMVFNKLPRIQKQLVKDEKLFFEKALAIHKLGIMKKFGNKVSKYKTEIELIKYMTEFINSHSGDFSFNSIQDKIKNMNAEIVFEDSDEGILVAEIFDYETSQKIGSSNWCISTSNNSWNQYKTNGRRQFFLWDFSREQTDSLSHIGFTCNFKGNIVYIHDKYDLNLREIMPDYLQNVIDRIDTSYNLNKFKLDLIHDIENIESPEMEKVSVNDDIIAVKINRENYSIFKSGEWSYNRSPFSSYSPSDIIPFNYYIVYNFNRKVTDQDFIIGVLASSDNDKISIEVMYSENEVGHLNISNNKIDSNLTNVDYIKSLYENGYIVPKDVSNINDELKEIYLNSISKLSTQNNGSDHLWLFRIYQESELRMFKPSKRGNSNMIRRKDGFNKIRKYNTYVIIDTKEAYNSLNFIRYIHISENNIEVVYNTNSDHYTTVSKVSELPIDIQKLIEKGDIKVKTIEEYDTEIETMRRLSVSSAQDTYESDKISNELSSALMDFLYKNNQIEIDKYDEYTYLNTLLPFSLHFDLYEYTIIDTQYLLEGYGTQWAIGDDDMYQASVRDYCHDIIYNDLGAIDRWMINDALDIDSLVAEYGKNISEVIMEIEGSPDEYGISLALTEEGEERLNDIQSKISDSKKALNDKESLKKKISEKKDEYLKFTKSKLDNIKLEIEKTDSTDEYERLSIISDKISQRLDHNLSRYGRLIKNVNEEIDNIEDEIIHLNDLIDEIEEQSNNNYWTMDLDEVREQATIILEEDIDEFAEDPIEYLRELGHSESHLNHILLEYIDQDYLVDLLQDNLDGSMLSQYNGIHHIYIYNNTEYHIFRMM